MPPSSTEQKSYAGAAFNALMEEETKEGVVVMLLQQFDRNRDLAAAAREMMEALEKAQDSIVALGTYIHVPGLEPAGKSLYAEGAEALRAIAIALSTALSLGLKTKE